MKVILTDEASRQYHKLPRAIRARMVEVFDRLEKWPDVSGAKPLRGEWKGNYRIRTGDYRLVFRIDGSVEGRKAVKEVVIWKIGDRKDVYLD